VHTLQVSERSSDAKTQENKKQPSLGLKLFIQVMTQESPYADGQAHGQADGTEIPEESEKFFGFFFHSAGSKTPACPARVTVRRFCLSLEFSQVNEFFL
jgi:hypothetical protein